MYETIREVDAPLVTAPDGSAVRPLLQAAAASMATFALAAGQVAAPVRHRSVTELWYVTAGRGVLWRSLDGAEATVALEPGVAVSLPLGTHFQFRAAPDEAVHILGVTLPPWPGPDEAIPVAGPWTPTG